MGKRVHRPFNPMSVTADVARKDDDIGFNRRRIPRRKFQMQVDVPEVDEYVNRVWAEIEKEMRAQGLSDEDSEFQRTGLNGT